MATRSFSRAEFRKSLSTKTISSLAQSSTYATLTTELRCYKHSPRVARKDPKVSIEGSDFEAGVWRQAFDAMGGLKRLRLKEFTPFTTLNKAPYHCLSLSRQYNVSYGKISFVEGGSVKGAIKPKEIKTSQCECIEHMSLPRLKEPITPLTLIHNNVRNLPRKMNVYVPKSCVLVWWNGEHYTAEIICEWLQSFGPFLFTIYRGNTTLLACFDNIKSAYRAVNCPLTNTGIHVKWNDVMLYNYGYYRMFENYSLGNDVVWGKHFGRRKKGPNVRSASQAQRKSKVVSF